MAEVYPLYFVLAGVIVYGAAYFLYARWYDKNVWEPDPKRSTPAHMYMDGIEFFPTSKYVLFGFQFKGIAALGPILGPFVGLSFGWVPALIWLLVGNFFIGWIHDYSALFMSVRNEGRTMGPLTYELISPRARSALLGFLLFYLILITSVFVLLCGLFFCLWPGSLIVTIFTIISGLTMGFLMYKMRVPIIHATIVGLAIICIGIWAGGYTQAVAPELMINPATGKPYLWVGMLITAIICFIGAITPIIWWTQPVNYAAFWPCTAGVILIILAAFVSPATGVAIQQPAFAPTKPELGVAGLYHVNVGPVWPLLCVSIACGAISGWHSLVGTSGSARQLDVETDALPVAAGAMLMEGLLALSALASYMVLTPAEVGKYVTKWGCFVAGACKLVAPMFLTRPENPYLVAFFGSFLELYAITVEQMVVRFFRLAMGEITAGRPILRAWIGNKYSAAAICLLVGGIFAYSGAWINLWLLFGGSNQLLAGLALLLTSIYLAKVKKPTIYNLAPAIFMIVTCEGALIWETFFTFLGLQWAIAGKKLGIIYGVPIAKGPLAELIAAGVGWAKGVALALNVIFFLFGLILIALGLIVAYDGFKSYAKFKRAAPEAVEASVE